MVTSRSPALSPSATTARTSSCRDTVTRRIATVKSSSMMKTNVPVGPRCTAEVGTTTTCRSVSISSRTLTNWPGQSCRFAFGNSALIRTVPVVGSTWLSITCTLPVSAGVRPSGPMASTGSGPSAMPRLSSGRFCCGRLNSTEIGLISVMVTSPVVSDGRTILPTSTWRMPVRPAIGAVMSV